MFKDLYVADKLDGGDKKIPKKLTKKITEFFVTTVTTFTTIINVTNITTVTR